MAVTRATSSALTIHVPATPPNYSVNPTVRAVTVLACARTSLSRPAGYAGRSTDPIESP
jgi:hypothetical protein